MSISTIDIIPVTRAREKLGDLIETKGQNYIILTKGGSPRAALVDIDYLKQLEKIVNKFYQKTFIDTKILPLTREFSDTEILEWEKEDAF